MGEGEGERVSIFNAAIYGKLNRVEQLLYEHNQFTSVENALVQVTRDYPKGYPTNDWIDGVLRHADAGTLIEVTWDKETGNYNWLGKKNEPH